MRNLAPWRLVVVRDGREEVHESPAVAGVLPKLTEAVGRAAEEGGSVQAWLETPDGRVVFAGAAGESLA